MRVYTATRVFPVARPPIRDGAVAVDDAYALETGQTCPVPNALPVALHATIVASDFKQMVRQSILSGGDSAGRLLVSAAIVGAHSGVPADWMERVEPMAKIVDLTDNVLDGANLGT